MDTITIKANIVGTIAGTRTKKTGAKYNLHYAEVTDGPLLGKKLLVQRTVLNNKQEVRTPCVMDEAVTLYMTVVEGTDGVKKPFFEVQRGVITLADADILAAYSM